MKYFLIWPQNYFLLRNIPSLYYLYSSNFVCYKTCSAQCNSKCAKTDYKWAFQRLFNKHFTCLSRLFFVKCIWNSIIFLIFDTAIKFKKFTLIKIRQWKSTLRFRKYWTNKSMPNFGRPICIFPCPSGSREKDWKDLPIGCVFNTRKKPPTPSSFWIT